MAFALYVVIWDRLYIYLVEAEKQLKDKKVYHKVKFIERILTDLVEKNNSII